MTNLKEYIQEAIENAKSACNVEWEIKNGRKSLSEAMNDSRDWMDKAESIREALEAALEYIKDLETNIEDHMNLFECTSKED